MHPNQHVEVERRDRCAILRIQNPPSNLLIAEVRAALRDALLDLRAAPDVGAFIITGRGHAFSTGADLQELASGQRNPTFHQLFAVIEASERPVIAAANALALGGGVELMLACHYRCAARPAVLGLPEVKLGVIPGAGGCQRLPRLIGARCAMELILSGKPVPAARALDMGLIDRVIDAPFLDGVIEYANELGMQSTPPRRTDRLRADTTGFDEACIARALQRFTLAGRPADVGTAAIEALRAAIELPFEAGIERERALAFELLRIQRLAGARWMSAQP